MPEQKVPEPRAKNNRSALFKQPKLSELKKSLNSLATQLQEDVELPEDDNTTLHLPDFPASLEAVSKIASIANTTMQKFVVEILENAIPTPPAEEEQQQNIT